MLRREAARFPPWFRTEAERLATISTETSGDRGIAFYGDERQVSPPGTSSTGRTPSGR